MRKVIAAINMTLDGFCDHTAMIADDEIHEHYNDLLRSTDTLVYGRITYELMQSYWPSIARNPTGNKPTDDFAILIDGLAKVVFSHTINNETPIISEWNKARVAQKDLKEEILELKNQAGKDILIGSPSLIISSLNLNLVDEFQISVQPTILGRGKRLFDNIDERISLELFKSKTFSSGVVTFYYGIK